MTQKNPMGLGEDPLDVLLSDPTPAPSKEEPPAAKPAVTRTPKTEREITKTASQRAGKSPITVEPDPEAPGPKVTVSLHLPLKLIERVRDAAYYVPGLTVSAIADRALSKEVAELSKEYERTYGQSIPKRTEPLRPGRPPKS